MTAVGIVSPGAMGSALGARLIAGGAVASAVLAGRSERTRRLAAAAGLRDAPGIEALLGEVDVVLSVVPPGEAVAVAGALADAAGRCAARPLVVDLNAVSPATALAIERRLGEAGLALVDGSISGPPPERPGTTRVYLSGERAGDALDALQLAGVDVRVVGDRVGLASAVKMCTASVYKGRVALLVQALRAAHAHGVVGPVLDDLVETDAVDRAQAGETVSRALSKAWRYVGEMEEIAATQSSAGLTPSLFQALAEVYAELASRADGAPEDVPRGIALDEVLADLAREP